MKKTQIDILKFQGTFKMRTIFLLILSILVLKSHAQFSSDKTLKYETWTSDKTNQSLTITPTGTGNVVLKDYDGFLKFTAGVPSEQTFISLTADVSGTLPEANGGTGVTDMATILMELAGDQTVSGTKTFDKELVMLGISTPSNPSAGDYKLYFKTDGNLYKLNSAGTEAQVGGGGSGDSSMIILWSSNGFGSTNTKIRRFSNYACSMGTSATSVGASQTCGDITCTDSAANGTECNADADGVYSVAYWDIESGSDISIGVSVNSSQLTTAIEAVNANDRIAFNQENGGGYWAQASGFAKLSSGDDIRAHGTGTETGGTGATLIIVRHN